MKSIVRSHFLTRASATAASTSVPVLRTLMAEIRAGCTRPKRSAVRRQESHGVR